MRFLPFLGCLVFFNPFIFSTEVDTDRSVRSLRNHVRSHPRDAMVFMLDIFNDLGTNYNSDIESTRNLFDVGLGVARLTAARKFKEFNFL